MSTMPPTLGHGSLVVAAMRAAAELVENSGRSDLSVTCDGYQVTVQVPETAGTAENRARMVAMLADLLGTDVLRDDSHTTTMSWLIANGVLSGITVKVFTPIPVQLTCHDDGAVTYRVLDAEGDRTQLAEGTLLPYGWRWVTELDQTG